MAARENYIVDKLDDLTSSLHRTTDVLSSADRMIDHYRDLNREQEHEIARLHIDLHKLSSDKRFNESKLRSSRSLRKDKKETFHDTSSELSSDDQQKRMASKTHKKYSSSPSRVHFERDSLSSDNEKGNLKHSIVNIKRRQDMIEREIQKDRQLRNDELDRLDLTLRKQFDASYQEEQVKTQMNNQLRKIQEQIEDDHNDWREQKKEIKSIADEMKSLKDAVLDATTPKSKNVKSRIHSPERMEEELNLYKRKCLKDAEIIKFLNEEVQKKERESTAFQSTIGEFQSLGKMKSDQLKLLEDQLQCEKSEKQKLFQDLEDLQVKLIKTEKKNESFLLQLSTMKADERSDQLAYERISQQVPELKRLLEKSERQRDKYSEHMLKIDSELSLKENIIEKLSSEVKESKMKMHVLEMELEKHVKQIEEEKTKFADIKQELDVVKTALSNAEKTIQSSEQSRKELKEKALNSIREYRSKCRQYEKQLQNAAEFEKTKELELSKEMANAKELEISNLKLQKKYQESVFEFEKLQNDVLEYENRLSELGYEKTQLQEALSDVNGEARQVMILQKEIQELKNEKMAINSQLLDEKSKRREFESLLRDNYEKDLTSKEESSALHKQILEERNNRMQEIAKMREESEKDFERKLDKLRDKIKKTENEKLDLETKLHVCREAKEEVDRKLEVQVKEKSLLLDTEKEFKEKIHRLAEENKKLRKHVQLSKLDYKEKLQVLESQLKFEKDQNTVLQERLEVNQSELKQLKDVAKILIYISNRDAENILNLLSHEEETVLPVKDIPETIPPEHRKFLLELREKLDTSYSIAKTLKRRFQQQKLLIKRAQERIKAQLKEINDVNQTHRKQCEKQDEQINELQKSQLASKESLMEKDRKILLLKSRVDELTKHLGECTRALHQTTEAEQERKNVLREIEQLKSEHVVNKKLDENYYKGSEKIEVLTEQLNEAKNSLSQMRQDSLDSNNFTNRVIETFGSVSPARKRKLYSFNSPRFKSTVRNLFDSSSLQSYFEDSKGGSPPRSTSKRTIDPMSMTDEEFNDIFIQNKSPRRSPRKSKSSQKENVRRSTESNKDKDGKKVSYEDD
ncbi:kinectin-like isoform X1 [Hydractinia symbiolongicarpus]|uniref:kinectin-like isoform X1 n=2 Tax=Hydractinia symbiolongicarpus TaxID=13093 RepID=UPI00254B8592|nr:kinectin-like isoform X1 [Hydractinia symbiolongicarpus]XP_057303243.1 kinectin-like isoform X1 [Hydractinia symbiolongicarpus]XP_057303244.1 kinectin-like isoform X1 [Hydractinia symbiolongicarpus]